MYEHRRCALLVTLIHIQYKQTRSYRTPPSEDEIPPMDSLTSLKRSIVLLLNSVTLPKTYAPLLSNEKLHNMITALIFIAGPTRLLFTIEA